MKYEDVMAEAYQGKSSPIDPGLLDSDFDICIKARANMTRPCFCTQETFFSTFTDPFGQKREAACWMGHILKAANAGGINGLEVPGEDDVGAFVNRISQKLGFISEIALYNFNDRNPHSTVLAEFDRCLQLWT